MANLKDTHDAEPSEILPGKLWLSGHRQPGSIDYADVVVGMAIECPIVPEDHPDLTVVYVPIFDNGPPSNHERKLAHETAQLVLEHLQSGRRVSVSCVAGINRSAWVVGLVLRKLTLTGPQALALIRQKRMSCCLSNQWFELDVLR